MSSIKRNILEHVDDNREDAKSVASDELKPNDNQLLEPNNLTSAKPSKCPRNPIVGSGLKGDGIRHLIHRTPMDRERGNPVTGEGYSPGRTDYERKTHVRPGEYSEGRW